MAAGASVYFPPRQRRSLNSSLGQRPRDQGRNFFSAESAIQFSVPNVAFVELHSVLVQQLPVLVLERSTAMVLFLPFNILQYSSKLARTHRKCRVPALPKEATVTSVSFFDPFGRRFLNPLCKLCLRNRSRQRCHDMHVVYGTANTGDFGAKLATNGCEIGVKALANISVKPWVAVLGAKHNVENNFAERLRHNADNARMATIIESRFQRLVIVFTQSWGVAPGYK
jgi:hypothetical protein